MKSIKSQKINRKKKQKKILELKIHYLKFFNLQYGFNSRAENIAESAN